MKDIELLPCPFCGSDDIAFTINGHDSVFVECMACGSSGPVAAWNARAAVDESETPREIAEEIAALLASTPAHPAPQPVERKPMTEQEGLLLAASLGWKIDFSGIGNDALELIAAVERHHGIRE